MMVVDSTAPGHTYATVGSQHYRDYDANRHYEGRQYPDC